MTQSHYSNFGAMTLERRRANGTWYKNVASGTLPIERFRLNMYWIKVHGALIDIENYRLFRCGGKFIFGMPIAEFGAGRVFDQVADYPSEEQADAAFQELSDLLTRIKVKSDDYIQM